MPGSVNAMGKALIDPSGKVHIGRNIDGFDSIDIARQLKEAKLAGVKKQTESIDRNKTVVIPAVHALQAQVQSLHDDAVALSNYLGALPTAPNVFNDLQATVVKSGEVTTSYINVTFDSAVASVTTNAVAVQIQQLACVDSRITDDTILTTGIVDNTSTPVTDPTAALGITGNIYINGIAIGVAPTDSISLIVSNINNSQAGVQTSIMPFGANFNLILNGNVVGTPLTFLGPLSETSTILSTNFGIDTTTPTITANLQAKLTYVVNDGVRGPVSQNYTSNTNIVTGLIPGVTLNLLSTTLNSSNTYDTLNISLSENTSGARDQILAFFNGYNSVQETLNRNTLVDDEGDPLDPNATMVGSPLIRSLSTQLSAISSFVLAGAGSGDYMSWQDIGIVKNETATDFDAGKYVLPDKNVLLSAISTNFKKIKKLFGDYPIVSNSNFDVSDLGPSLDSSIAGQPITIIYSRTGTSYFAEFACGGTDTGPVLQTDQYNLIGPVGTVFSGITIGYSGVDINDGASITFTLTATQGLADRVAKLFDQTLDSSAGDFATESALIKKKNDKLREKIEKAEKEAEKIEKKWIAQAVHLDAARAKYDQFSRQLDNMFNYNKN